MNEFIVLGILAIACGFLAAGIIALQLSLPDDLETDELLISRVLPDGLPDLS